MCWMNVYTLCYILLRFTFQNLMYYISHNYLHSGIFMPKKMNSENSETMRAAKTVAHPQSGSTITTGLTTNTINTLQSDKHCNTKHKLRKQIQGMTASTNQSSDTEQKHKQI